MRRLTVLSFAGALALASIGCESAANSNTNVNKALNSNSNVAVVVNNNSNAVVLNESNSNGKTNYNVSREEYDKNKEDYAKRAKEAGSTIGSGLNDGWIWTKTKAALTAADDLRDSTINVDVDKDVITLKGTVANAAQKAKAETVAKGIEGQKGVKNELKVQAGDSMTNQMVNGNSSSNAKSMNSNANMKK